MSEKKQIEIDFEMEQRVKIIVNAMIGKINGIWIDLFGIKYNVEWVGPDTSLNNRWFAGKELERV